MSGAPNKDDADAWLIWLGITAQIDRAAQHGVADLPESAWRVLVYLSRRSDAEPIDIDAIGEGCTLSAATVSRALAELEAVGYLKTRRSNRDGRLVDRVVTKAGRHALGTIEDAARSHR